MLDGKVTLGYASLDGVRSRLATPPSVLSDSVYSVLSDTTQGVTLRDPWGTIFELIEQEDVDDLRGSQPRGDEAEPRAILDLMLHVPRSKGREGLEAIGRYYERVLGMAVLSCSDERLVLSAGGGSRVAQ